MSTEILNNENSIYYHEKLRGYLGQVPPYDKVVEALAHVYGLPVSVANILDCQNEAGNYMGSLHQNTFQKTSLDNLAETITKCQALIEHWKQTAANDQAKEFVVSNRSFILGDSVKGLQNRITLLQQLQSGLLLMDISNPTQRTIERNRNCQMLGIAFSVLALAAVYIGISTKSF